VINSLIAGTLFANIGYLLLMFFVIFFVVMTIPSFIIQPYMARGQVHTGLLMFAYILGPLVFGISGLFLGAIVLVLLTHYFGIVVPTIAQDGQENHDFHL
jgi:predicted PurR-regulated permease PerM